MNTKYVDNLNTFAVTVRTSSQAISVSLLRKFVSAVVGSDLANILYQNKESCN